MMRLLVLLSLSLFMLGLASPAFAEKRPSNIANEKAAKKACSTGDFIKGVDILADLFVDTNDLAYVYNQGRCYQQNNRWEQAISRFNEYLRKAKDISESDRAETERQIADCEQALAKSLRVAPPSVAEPHPVPVTVPATEVSVPAPVLVADKPEPSTAEGSRGKGLRVTGIVFAAVGVAAVGTGVGLALKANGLSTTDYSRSREDERASLKTWSLVSYGAGAAAIATGVVLYVVGWPNEESSSVALLPVVAPDGASVLLNGRF